MPVTSAQEYQALFNNAAIGIITVNTRGEIVLANQFALMQFGYEQDELTGKKIETLIPSRFKPLHEQHRNDYHHANPHSRPMGTGMDLFAVRKGGVEFPVEVSLSVYQKNEEQFAIAFISDISVRKSSEQALMQLNMELEEKVEERTRSLTEALEKEMELNELKSRFVSMASHEFRTPLSTILSSAYLVSKYIKTEEQPRRDKHIQRIVSSVNMLTDILNDFLSVGRIEEGKIQLRLMEIHIPELLENQVAELRPILKNGQEIVVQHEGPDQVILDPTLLRHIIINLVSNAIKFSPEGSEILIRSRNGPDGYRLAVKDQGMGISEEDQQHLFERFFRGSNVITIQGTGLGLHIVSKYAELMHGTVSCHSQLEKGTEFIIQFAPQPSL